MSIHPMHFSILFLMLSMGGCAPAQPPGPSARGDGRIRTRNGATILTGVTLTETQGSILAAMEGRVPNLRVRIRPQGCSAINLRNQTAYRPVSPLVYVDGARATDTCILESLRAQDVESVEIYPMGFTTRPGYASHAHGLILVFLLGAKSAGRPIDPSHRVTSRPTKPES